MQGKLKQKGWKQGEKADLTDGSARGEDAKSCPSAISRSLGLNLSCFSGSWRTFCRTSALWYGSARWTYRVITLCLRMHIHMLVPKGVGQEMEEGLLQALQLWYTQSTCDFILKSLPALGTEPSAFTCLSPIYTSIGWISSSARRHHSFPIPMKEGRGDNITTILLIYLGHSFAPNWAHLKLWCAAARAPEKGAGLHLTWFNYILEMYCYAYCYTIANCTVILLVYQTDCPFQSSEI